MEARDFHFLVIMGGTCQPYGSAVDFRQQLFFLLFVDGQRQSGVFQVAQTFGFFCAQHFQTVSVFVGLSQTIGKTGQQFLADKVELLPAFKRTVGNSAVNQNQRNVLAFDGGKHGRP